MLQDIGGEIDMLGCEWIRTKNIQTSCWFAI